MRDAPRKKAERSFSSFGDPLLPDPQAKSGHELHCSNKYVCKIRIPIMVNHHAHKSCRSFTAGIAERYLKKIATAQAVYKIFIYIYIYFFLFMVG